VNFAPWSCNQSSTGNTDGEFVMNRLNDVGGILAAGFFGLLTIGSAAAASSSPASRFSTP
jgi:hypothetical protein